MPAPSAEVFDRLRSLAAIKDGAARQTKTIDEVFTGKPLTTIPSARPKMSKPPSPRRARRRPTGRTVRSASASMSSAGIATWSSRTASS